jgi:hypothetical protein
MQRRTSSCQALLAVQSLPHRVVGKLQGTQTLPVLRRLQFLGRHVSTLFTHAAVSRLISFLSSQTFSFVSTYKSLSAVFLSKTPTVSHLS